MTRRPLVLLGLACATAAGAFAVWLATFHVPGAGRLDDRALQTFTSAAPPRLTPSIHGVADLANPAPFVVIGLALLLVALARRRWLMAAAVPLILLAANLTTQQLKPSLADLRVVDLRAGNATYLGSWPSGHSTASMSLALCLVLVAGPRMRPLAALIGAGYAIAVGYSLVVLGYHLPSDVFGGYLVAATFTLLGAAALSALEARRPARATATPPSAVSAPALAGLAALLVAFVALVVLIRRPGTTLDALEHPSAMLTAIAIAALGLALPTGLASVLRR
ncbi:MAG TPA: phosphatase PAP2 family protein [Solirubrobacteraceae bacterium]